MTQGARVQHRAETMVSRAQVDGWALEGAVSFILQVCRKEVEMFVICDALIESEVYTYYIYGEVRAQ